MPLLRRWPSAGRFLDEWDPRHSCSLLRHVLWPRIDQKTCLKAIVSAGYEAVPIANEFEGDEVICVFVQVPHALNAQIGIMVGSPLMLVEMVRCSLLEVRTNLAALEAEVVRLGAGSIAAIITTASCFAPRGPDKLIDVVRTLSSPEFQQHQLELQSKLANCPAGQDVQQARHCSHRQQRVRGAVCSPV
jgi:O-phosphoseryl-tRNA(Sec) selenium transferase, SepSecS